MFYYLLDREKKSTNAISLDPIAGSSVTEALDVYDEITDLFLSKIYTTVLNYGKWPLSSPDHKIENGETLLTPQLVLPGHKEAWAAKQSFADGIGTKGITAWSTSPGRLCFYYWYIEHNFFEREDNEMAIGCLPVKHTIDDLFDMVEEVKELDGQRNEYMVYQQYGNDQPTIQFCDDLLCVQGSMTSTYDCKATLSFYPKKVEDLATSFQGEIKQSSLDQILNKGNQYKLAKTISGQGNAFRCFELVFLITVGFIGRFL